MLVTTEKNYFEASNLIDCCKITVPDPLKLIDCFKLIVILKMTQLLSKFTPLIKKNKNIDFLIYFFKKVYFKKIIKNYLKVKFYFNSFFTIKSCR